MKAMMAAGLAALACTGCQGASQAVVDRPSELTLSNALVQTVEALYASRKRAADLRRTDGQPQLGLNVCTVSATFNISATGTDTRGATESIGTPPNLYVSATITGNQSSTSTATRGNQITVTFTSPACNPPDTLGTKSPGDVVLLEREIEAAREGDPDPIHRGSPPRARARRPAGSGGVTGATPAAVPDGPSPAVTSPAAPQPTTAPGGAQGSAGDSKGSLNDRAPGHGSTYARTPKGEKM